MKDENYRAYRLSNAATLIHPGSTHRWRIFSSRSGDPIAFRPATFAEILGFEACNFASEKGLVNGKPEEFTIEFLSCGDGKRLQKTMKMVMVWGW